MGVEQFSHISFVLELEVLLPLITLEKVCLNFSKNFVLQILDLNHPRFQIFNY
jgi:hypothetical protein